MTIKRRLARIFALLRANRLERELGDEVRAHLELAEHDAIARGLDPAEARRDALRQFGGIEQMSGTLRLSQGSIYPALMRLEQQGWISTKWGVSETNRKVKFYSLTRAGAKQLHVEVANWEQAAALVARILDAKA